jgi:hypothetical protein
MYSNTSTLTNGASASKVFGQSDYTTGDFYPITTQYQFGQPTSVYVNGTTAWIADRTFNRVLRFDNVYNKANGANADGVLGQTGFATNTSDVTQSTMNHPIGVCTDEKGNLYVLDQGNNRILIYLNAANKSMGANADYVLGQPNFYEFTAKYNNNGFYPVGLTTFAVDNSRGKLLVVDFGASRVLQFASSGALTGIDQYESSKVSNKNNPFNLSVYPNPIITEAHIQFQISHSGNYSLKIYNSQGQEVAMLINKSLQPDTYTFHWNTINQPGGIYFCRLTGGGFTETNMISVVK